MHYIFEPGSFVPVAQAIRQQPIRLLAQPTYEGDYDEGNPPLKKVRIRSRVFS